MLVWFGLGAAGLGLAALMAGGQDRTDSVRSSQWSAAASLFLSCSERRPTTWGEEYRYVLGVREVQVVMIIRIRSPEGTIRVTAQPTDLISSLVENIKRTWNKPLSLTRDPKGEHHIRTDISIGALGLSHGDMLYASFLRPDSSQRSNAPKSPAEESPQDQLKRFVDPVDTYWEGKDGKVPRGRSTLCRHGSNAMCEHCSPLEPFDTGYMKENKIKHLSFNAYQRKLTQGNTMESASLIPEDFRVKIGCNGGHSPWPAGFCSKCQPSAVTLGSQSFRIVDHVEFESPAIIDSFIGYWRSSGVQRFGFMYGYYAPYDEVPLGIKAVVAAIYEPPQEGMEDELSLAFVPGKSTRKDPEAQNAEKELSCVDQLAQSCGMRLIGMIFTDLLDDGSKTGKVICKRHIKSYYVSSLETLFSAKMQLQYPNVSRASTTKAFGSKFVSCVLTGNEDGDVDIFAYQASNTAMAMAQANMVEASVTPSVMRVKDSDSTLYVPEVFYTFKNEYNTTVKRPAKPTFPVEYLMVNVTHGFPSSPTPRFLSGARSRFPIENRKGVEPITLASLNEQIKEENLIERISDFHFLLYVKNMEIFSEEDFALLCRVAVEHSPDALGVLQATQSWEALLSLCRHSGMT